MGDIIGSIAARFFEAFLVVAAVYLVIGFIKALGV